jgi:hypothetical protein
LGKEKVVLQKEKDVLGSGRSNILGQNLNPIKSFIMGWREYVSLRRIGMFVVKKISFSISQSVTPSPTCPFTLH